MRPHWSEIDELMRQWPAPNEAERLGRTITPLMRLAPLWGLDELQFRVLCERLTVAWLKTDPGEQAKTRERIQDAIASLADNIPQVQRVQAQRVWTRSPQFWEHLDLARLEMIQTTFAPLMRYRVSATCSTVEINLPDTITQRSWIIYGPTGEGAFAASYRGQVEALVWRLADQLPEFAKLKKGEPLSDDELERIIAQHGYLRANQLNFLRAVKTAVMHRGGITRAALSEPPLARIGYVEALFSPQDIEELVSFANRLVGAVA